MLLVDRCKTFINKRFDTWLARRMPSAEQQTLSQRNIFILPSLFGVGYLMFVTLLFVLGTNYQNNLILLMSYLLASLFISAMLSAFSNISGLTVSSQGEFIGFAGEDISVPVTINSRNLRHCLALAFRSQPPIIIDDLLASQTIKVPVNFARRGRHQLGRLTVESEFPLGLFRCWTHLQFDVAVVVCPSPIKCYPLSLKQPLVDDQQQAGVDPQLSGDDFHELKSYIPGQSINLVAWKQLARTGQWYSKHYQGNASEQIILSLQQMPASHIETKLGQLAFMLLQYEQSELEYGVQLGDKLLPPGQGKNHLQQALTMLACYEH